MLQKYFQEYFESTLTESSRMKTLLTDVIQTCKVCDLYSCKRSILTT